MAGAGSVMAGAADVAYGANGQGPELWPWPAGMQNTLNNQRISDDLGGQAVICASCNSQGTGGLANGYATLTWWVYSVAAGSTKIESVVVLPAKPGSTTW